MPYHAFRFAKGTPTMKSLFAWLPTHPSILVRIYVPKELVSCIPFKKSYTETFSSLQVAPIHCQSLGSLFSPSLEKQCWFNRLVAFSSLGPTFTSPWNVILLRFLATQISSSIFGCISVIWIVIGWNIHIVQVESSLCVMKFSAA